MKNTTGMLFDIQHFSLHDGPGVRTTVFFKGCPLRCRWCSNPESQSEHPQMMHYAQLCVRCGLCREACPNDAIVFDPEGNFHRGSSCTVCGECAKVCPHGASVVTGYRASVEDVCKAVDEDWRIITRSGGGMTVSGGEPFAQPQFLHDLLEAIHGEFGFQTCIETSAFTSWNHIESVLPFLDTMYVDMKHMISLYHRAGTGVDNDADGCLTEDDIDILLAADEEDARAKKEIQARRKTVTIERIARKRTATKIQRILISERELADLKEDTRTSVGTIKAGLNRLFSLCRTYLNIPFEEDPFSEDAIDFSKYEPYAEQMSAKDRASFNVLVNRYKRATVAATKKRAEIEAFRNEAVKDLSEQVSNGTYAFKDTELFTDRTKLGKIAILKNAYIVEVGDYIEDNEYIYKVEEFEDRNRTSMIIQSIASKKYGCDKVGKEQLVECADFEAFPCVYSQDDFSFLKDIKFSVRRYKDIASIPVDIYNRNKETISIFHKPHERSKGKRSLCVLYYNGKYEIRYMQNTLTLKRVVHPSEVGDISQLAGCINPKSFSEDIDFEDNLLDLLSVLQIDERTAKKLVSDLKQRAGDQLLD